MNDTPEALEHALRAGDRRALARAITLVESSRADHRAQAWALLERVMPATGKAIRVGVSGSPGVGKSTFIEALGAHVIGQGRRVAVLAVDPSSSVSGGSILGDKTRMEKLSRRPEAFIRPSPASGALGGVAPRTREAALLCEAAGYDTVFVETVGVGQSETAVAGMTDVFVLLLLPGGGDELQGIKRGIVELADLILVNKADGELAGAAGRTVADYRQALGLPHPAGHRTGPPVEPLSALTGEGLESAWRHITRRYETLRENGELDKRRADQNRAWFWSETSERLMAALKNHPGAKREIPRLERAVTEGTTPPAVAARRLMDLFLKGDS